MTPHELDQRVVCGETLRIVDAAVPRAPRAFAHRANAVRETPRGPLQADRQIVWVSAAHLVEKDETVPLSGFRKEGA